MFSVFLKPVLAKDPNVESILYADRYQKIKIYNGKKIVETKLLIFEISFFFPFQNN
jgi:putative ABC transport system permease protein